MFRKIKLKVVNLIFVILIVQIVRCQSSSEDSTDTTDQEDLTKLIYPGTKWCGPGNIATDDNDLGSNKETDKCCREHDHCDYIGAFQTKYGLFNNNFFSKLHCRCDEAFIKCLKNVNNTASHQVGTVYFHASSTCYRNDYPKLDCALYDKAIYSKRCNQYFYDTNQEKKYQWFDLPYFDSTNQHDFKGNSED